MTLYVPLDLGTPDSYREASRAEVLRASGWVDCKTCLGKGRRWRSIETPMDAHNYPCSDCMDGVVPSDEMVEAAFDALDFEDGSDPEVRQHALDSTRAALVAAARTIGETP